MRKKNRNKNDKDTKEKALERNCKDTNEVKISSRLRDDNIQEKDLEEWEGQEIKSNSNKRKRIKSFMESDCAPSSSYNECLTDKKAPTKSSIRFSSDDNTKDTNQGDKSNLSFFYTKSNKDKIRKEMNFESLSSKAISTNKDIQKKSEKKLKNRKSYECVEKEQYKDKKKYVKTQENEESKVGENSSQNSAYQEYTQIDSFKKSQSSEKRKTLILEKEKISIKEFFKINHDIKSVYMHLFDFLYRLLLKRCSEDYSHKLDNDLKLEDFLDFNINITQQDVWKINSSVLKLRNTKIELENEMKRSIEEFILKDLEPIIDTSEVDMNDTSALCIMFIDFIVNIFVIYRRTLIVLRDFQNICKDFKVQEFMKYLKNIKLFFDELRKINKADNENSDNHLYICYVQAIICRPLFHFQIQNKSLLERLKSSDFLKFNSTLNHEAENEFMFKENEESFFQKNVRNFLICLSEKDCLISDGFYEKISNIDNKSTENHVSHVKSEEFKKPKVLNKNQDQNSWENAMRRHLFLMNTVKSNVERNVSDNIISPAEMKIFKENTKFVWNDEDGQLTWGQRIAKKYYDRLFKEYCLIDLSRYKENKFGMRWRIERDLHLGKGQFVCGEVRCQETNKLTSWEVLFSYQERGKKNSTLVKVRLCNGCSDKLNYYREHRKIKQAEKRNFQNRKQFSFELQQQEAFNIFAQLSEKSKVNSISTSGEFDCPQRLYDIWDLPMKKETVEEDIEKELDEFLDSIID